MNLNYSILKSAMALALVAGLASFAQADVVVLNQTDWVGAGYALGTANPGYATEHATDPTASGHGEVLELDISFATGQWSGINFNVSPSTAGAWDNKDATLSFDYYIPTGTNLAGNQHLYAQVSTNPGGNNVGSGGFVGNHNVASNDTWFPMVANVNLGDAGGAGVSDVTLFALLNNLALPAPAAGTSVYIDNFQFSVVPEPTSMLLLGLPTLGLAIRRRR